jgi:hypothetical protein
MVTQHRGSRATRAAIVAPSQIDARYLYASSARQCLGTRGGWRRLQPLSHHNSHEIWHGKDCSMFVRCWASWQRGLSLHRGDTHPNAQTSAAPMHLPSTRGSTHGVAHSSSRPSLPTMQQPRPPRPIRARTDQERTLRINTAACWLVSTKC